MDLYFRMIFRAGSRFHVQLYIGFGIPFKIIWNRRTVISASKYPLTMQCDSDTNTPRSVSGTISEYLESAIHIVYGSQWESKGSYQGPKGVINMLLIFIYILLLDIILRGILHIKEGGCVMVVIPSTE